MRNTLMFAGMALLSITAATPAGADEVFLKDAGVLSGRVVARSPEAVEIEVPAGRITIPMSRVERIEERRNILDEYDERAGALGPRSTSGWIALARWAADMGLSRQSRQAYEHVLAVAPDNAEANRALGKVELNSRWVSRDESYRARGYVRFEDAWVTPEERESILRDRAEREERLQFLVETDARVREAEARVLEAEARAAEAEAVARQTVVEGIPLWWVWGPGPVVWPSGPVVGSSSACTYGCR
jgi:hypothetical protein